MSNAVVAVHGAPTVAARFDDHERAWLAAMDDVFVVKDYRDKAQAIVDYVRKARLGLQAQNDAAERKLYAEHRLGELTTEMDKNEGGRPPENPSHDVRGLEVPPTYRDLGLEYMQVSRWQKVSGISEAFVATYVNRVRANVELLESGLKVGKDDPTEVTTSGLVRAWQMAVHKSSEEDEWLTPPDIIARTLQVLGAIDLDPCSNTFGDPNVPAAVRFVEGDDGLGRTWLGRVYMNPPYGATIAAWTTKLASEHAAGNVTEAIALVPARTDTEWWVAMRDTAICFVRGRLKFSGAANSAPFPSAVAYFGERRDDFAAAFGEIGDIWTRLDDERR